MLSITKTLCEFQMEASLISPIPFDLCYHIYKWNPTIHGNANIVQLPVYIFKLNDILIEVTNTTYMYGGSE